MNHTMILKKLIVYGKPSGTLLVATVFAASETKEEEKKILVRPRDLSIYGQPAKQTSEEPEPKADSALLSAVRQVRQGLWAVTDQLGQVTGKINHVVETGKAHTSSSIQVLRDEENYPQRYGAIAVGGLLGYIVSIRRGWFRRIIYTVTGAVAVAAICYPEEAKEHSSEIYRQSKHYTVIAYHFLNGVLRDYVGVQLPSLPSPLSTAVESAPSSATLMPPPASGPSHISSPPMPPIDKPSSVSGSDKKQGNSTKGPKKSPENRTTQKKTDDHKPEPQPTSYVLPDPGQHVAERDLDYTNLYSRRS